MTITFLSGLPASGKSSYAKAQCAANPNIVRVNKDEIRTELTKTGWKWSHENEKDVERIRDTRIEVALSMGYDVIVDDTNFGQKHRRRIQELAKKWDATFTEKFFDIDVEEAIRRDAGRGPNSVGEAVIRRMAAQYLPARVVPYTETPGLPYVVLCDLDGTAALIVSRSPYDGGNCHLDAPNIAVRTVLQALAPSVMNDHVGYQIVYFSARDDCHKDKTLTWLQSHAFPTGALHMRVTGDTRKDTVVKGELFDAHVRGKYNVLLVLDDRTSVVNYWRSLGLSCFQVAAGDF